MGRAPYQIIVKSTGTDPNPVNLWHYNVAEAIADAHWAMDRGLFIAAVDRSGKVDIPLVIPARPRRPYADPYITP